MTNLVLNKSDVQQIIKDKGIRVNLAKESHLWFSLIYFSHYFKFDLASFHYQMIDLINHPEYQVCVMMTFRDSGKSTLITMSTPLYALFGKPQKKFILLISQTMDLAKAHLSNIKKELEENELLKQDLGPFREVENTWNSQAIFLPQQKALIKAVSIDQSIRGIRHKEHRPDLIICDDIEDSQSIKTEEGRKKIQDMFASEIVPLGDINTQIYLVGNNLHPNALLNKYAQQIRAKKIVGKSLFVPLVDEDKQISWPQKFKSWSEIEKLRAVVADERTWQREYLLKFITDNDHFYTNQNIRFYNTISGGLSPHFQYRVAALDLAISDKVYADNTAMLVADVYKVNDKHIIYLLPRYFNNKIGFIQTLELVRNTYRQYNPPPHFFIESTGYQRAVVEQIQKDDRIPVTGIDVTGMSKRERLALTLNWNEKGQILFPTHGLEPLIDQLIGFGDEKHDDLVDAYSLLVNQVAALVREGRFPTGIGFPPGIKINRTIRRHPIGSSSFPRGVFMSGLKSIITNAQ